jgi:preprotein translocase SecE subunit
VGLQIYKNGQGRYVRVATAIGLGLVVIVLCYYVGTLMAQYMADSPVKVYVQYAVPTVVFVGMGLGLAYYLNKPGVVDFLVATESEMKKVAWSSRAELIGSTVVVIVTVFLLAVLIFLVDYLVSGGLSKGWTIPFTSLHIPGLGLW